MNKWVIYTDGGARGNPGPAGIGVVIRSADGKKIKEIRRFLGRQTNNFAEYAAVIIALEELKKLVPGKERKNAHVEIRMDSELVVRQLTNAYQIKEPTLFPLFIKIHNMQIADFPHAVFTHVRREENKEADALANEAMDKNA